MEIIKILQKNQIKRLFKRFAFFKLIKLTGIHFSSETHVYYLYVKSILKKVSHHLSIPIPNIMVQLITKHLMSKATTFNLIFSYNSSFMSAKIKLC
jgi:hypothetical protein